MKTFLVTFTDVIEAASEEAAVEAIIEMCGDVANERDVDAFQFEELTVGEIHAPGNC